jgi:hypothetical protein
MSTFNETRAQVIGLHVMQAALSLAEGVLASRSLRDEVEGEAKANYRYAADELEQARIHVMNVRARLGLPTSA